MECWCAINEILKIRKLNGERNLRNALLKQVSGVFPQFVHMLNYPIFAILF